MPKKQLSQYRHLPEGRLTSIRKSSTSGLFVQEFYFLVHLICYFISAIKPPSYQESKTKLQTWPMSWSPVRLTQDDYQYYAIDRDYEKKKKKSQSSQLSPNTLLQKNVIRTVQNLSDITCSKFQPEQCANLLCHTTALITERDPSSVLGLRIFICRQRKQTQCQLHLHKLRNCTGSIMRQKHFLLLLFGLRLRINLAQHLEDPEPPLCDTTFLQLLRLETSNSPLIFFPQVHLQSIISKSY